MESKEAFEKKQGDSQAKESQESGEKSMESTTLDSLLLQSPKLKECVPKHENLLKKLIAHKQSHLLAYAEELDTAALETFFEQVQCIDFELMDMLYSQLILNPKKEFEEEKIEPIANCLRLTSVNQEERLKLSKLGMDIISKGKLAIVLLSGGQGTRLGFEHAKGIYNIGMPSNKSLFQYFAERIQRISELALKTCDIADKDPKKLISFYVMTSEMNTEEIKKYFADNDFFGLDPKKVTFFCQQSFPALNFSGKIISEQKHKISMAPNGNGGCLTSLENLNLISQMKNDGISYVQIIGVDNVLAKIGDPYFLGYAAAKDYDVTCKYVPKRSPTEPAGVFVLRNGKPHVIEYSEIPKALSELTDANGKLVYDSANILNALYKIEFLENILSSKKKELASQYHIAKKKIQYYDDKLGQSITPSEPNGYKFELFIHDCFQLCAPEKFGVIEAKREEEFAPVKNAPGAAEDSPDTARALISRLHQGWLKKYAIEFEAEASGEKTGLCEIDQKLSYEGEGLDEFASKLKEEKIKLPFYLKP